MQHAHVYPDGIETTPIELIPYNDDAPARDDNVNSTDPAKQRMLWHALWLLDGPSPPELTYSIRESGGGPHLYNCGNDACQVFGRHHLSNDNTISAPNKGFYAHAIGQPIGPFSLNRNFGAGTENLPGPSYNPEPQNVVSNVWVTRTEDGLELWTNP